FGCSFQVDIINADSGAANNLQVRCLFNQFPCHLRLASHQQGIKSFNALPQLFRSQIGFHDNVYAVCLAQRVNPFFAKWITDQYMKSHLVSFPSVKKTCCAAAIPLPSSISFPALTNPISIAAIACSISAGEQ